MENNLQVVLNSQSYASDDEAAEVMIALVQGINDWEESQSIRVPCAIVLGDHKWLPQKTALSTLSKNKDDDGYTLLQKLQQCFLGTLASRGRKRGMGLIFATQRLAMLDKNLIMCEWLFLLRQTLPNDLQAYREMGCPPEVAQKLGNGQAYVITPTKEHGTHQIRKRFSEFGAKTPGLAELEEYRRSRMRPVPTSQKADGNGDEEITPPNPSLLPRKLDVSTITTWLETGKIDDVQFLALFHTISLGGNKKAPGNASGNGEEIAPQAVVAARDTDAFPTSEAIVEMDHLRSEIQKPDISMEILNAIREMKSRGFKDLEIASIVKLDGRKYGTYKQAVAWIQQEQEA